VRLASFLATVFPHWTGLQLDAICLEDQHLIVELTATRRSAWCPDCHWRSRHAHCWFTVRTRWILVRPLDELDADEQAYRHALCQ
jgi:hypothetical protein